MPTSPVADAPTLSAAIFGNRHLATVLTAAAELYANDGIVTTRRVAIRTGLADSIVRAVLLRLVDGHVITTLWREGGARGQQFYGLRDDVIAQAVVHAAGVVARSRDGDRSAV